MSLASKRRTARLLVASIISEAITQGDEWTWKQNGTEDPALKH